MPSEQALIGKALATSLACVRSQAQVHCSVVNVEIRLGGKAQSAIWMWTHEDGFQVLFMFSAHVILKRRLTTIVLSTTLTNVLFWMFAPPVFYKVSKSNESGTALLALVNSVARHVPL